MIAAARPDLAEQVRSGDLTIPQVMRELRRAERTEEIVLKGNIRREGLDSYEASAQRMKEIRVIEAELAEEVSRNRYEKVSGRPKGGNSELGRRLGVSEGTVRNTKKHVAMADRFPSMKHKDWNQGLVLAAEEYMAAMVPEAEAVFKEELSGHRVRPAETRRNKARENCAHRARASHGAPSAAPPQRSARRTRRRPRRWRCATPRPRAPTSARPIPRRWCCWRRTRPATSTSWP